MHNADLVGTATVQRKISETLNMIKSYTEKSYFGRKSIEVSEIYCAKLRIMFQTRLASQINYLATPIPPL